ncbi:hypothetical protein NDU88_001846 [Pleurodeles waltl]|uniref:Uncharacterized protein n=1 Tax=Pleurodeles waltl TaxID=8319 RepID=A0AAV7W167_PLEWA|nr:hypothetical protein NDU88_001846 [Pleurodeles waltl]
MRAVWIAWVPEEDTAEGRGWSPLTMTGTRSGDSKIIDIMTGGFSLDTLPRIQSSNIGGSWLRLGAWQAHRSIRTGGSHEMLCDVAQDKAAWEGLHEQVIGAVTRLDGKGLTHGRTDGSHP